MKLSTLKLANMANKICFTPPFLLLCIALFLCQSLAADKNVVDNNDQTSFLNANVQAEYNKMSSKQADWWLGRPMFPWPFVHPPLPSGIPKFPWPFVHPPLPSGIPKFNWPFVHPPLPSGFPKFPWPFVHPPLPAGFPKIQWPFVPPPIPSGGLKFPPNFPWFHFPSIPPYMQHPHGNNAGVADEISTASTNPKCSSTNEIVESCMRASGMSHSWGYIFSPDCCKAIAEVSDECHPTFVTMIKDQCSNKATAPPPTA